MFTIGQPAAEETIKATGEFETVALKFNLYSSGFNLISSLDFAEDGRLFVAERQGFIKIVDENGNTDPTPFLDLSNTVGTNGEQGLSSFILHPQFESNDIFFVNYTTPQGVTNLSRFQTSATDPNQADPNSEEILISLMQPSEFHNGAGMVFGPDGYLYAGFGDGGDFGDPNDNGQNGLTLFGSILRIDVDGFSSYAIPPDNPFVGDPNVLDEIWAMGLRNPWRFGFDPLTGDLYITDVGEAQWEEIDFEAAGSGGGFNYGWRCYQGFEPFNTAGCQPPAAYTFPDYVFSHKDMCAIIGGHVYRGELYPMIYGHYLVADFCSGRIWGLQRQPGNDYKVVSSGSLRAGGVTTFARNGDGELFVAQVGNIFGISAVTIGPTPQYLPVIHNGE